ncbi:MAG TPA: hypothetical protein VIY56_09510 [Vicinamibacterales bacterium]
MAALTESLRLMRPRTIAQISKTATETAEQTREIKSTLKSLSKDASLGVERSLHLEHAVEQQSKDFAKELKRLNEDLAVQLRAMQNGIEQQIRGLSEELQAARLRESQLRAVMQRNLELEDEEATLRDQMKDLDGIRRHVQAAFAATELHLEPFPYAVVDNLLPPWLYDALLTGLPPVELYGDRAVNRQQLTVPFDLAPNYSHRVWRYMAKTVVDDVLMPAVLGMFMPSLRAWIHESFPAASAEMVAGLPIKSAEGRIMYRRRGYYIKPHRDPKWGMITGIFYLAKPGDDERWGTDLYSVANDIKAPSVAPYWITEERCQHERLVENRPNRVLLFLNSKGAHGARIPEGLADVEVERSIYQFKLGPRLTAMRQLIATLPPDEQKIWLGKAGDY